MYKLKVNPELRVYWRDGKVFLMLPGEPRRELKGAGAVELLAVFATSQLPDQVVRDYEDQGLAQSAIETLFRHGALILRVRCV